MLPNSFTTTRSQLWALYSSDHRQALDHPPQGRGGSRRDPCRGRSTPLEQDGSRVAESPHPARGDFQGPRKPRAFRMRGWWNAAQRVRLEISKSMKLYPICLRASRSLRKAFGEANIISIEGPFHAIMAYVRHSFTCCASFQRKPFFRQRLPDLGGVKSPPTEGVQECCPEAISAWSLLAWKSARAPS